MYTSEMYRPSHWQPENDPESRSRISYLTPESWLQCHEVIKTAVATRFDDQGETTITIRANEPGVVDLGRLLISASTPPIADGRIRTRIDGLARVTSVLVFNAHQKLRGLSEVRRPYEVEAPAGVFSPLRRQCSIDLGRVRLAADDTLAMTVRLSSGNRPGLGVAVAVPFQPDMVRNLSRQVDEVQEPHVLLGSPRVASVGAAAFSIQLTFEEDGVVNLGSLHLSGVCAFRPGEVMWDALSPIVVESFRLPSGEDLIVGNLATEGDDKGGWLGVPANVFADFGRMGPWFQLGPLAVRRGQQIVIRLRRLDREGEPKMPEASFSAGMSFYPSTAMQLEGRIKPSIFFGPWRDV